MYALKKFATHFVLKELIVQLFQMILDVFFVYFTLVIYLELSMFNYTNKDTFSAFVLSYELTEYQWSLSQADDYMLEEHGNYQLKIKKLLEQVRELGFILLHVAFMKMHYVVCCLPALANLSLSYVQTTLPNIFSLYICISKENET